MQQHKRQSSQIKYPNLNKQPSKYFINLFYNNKDNSSNFSNNNGGNNEHDTRSSRDKGKQKMGQFQNIDYNANRHEIGKWGKSSPQINYYVSVSPSTESRFSLVCIIGLILFSILCCLLYRDMESQYALQLNRHQRNINQCLKQFNQNDCHNPVEVLVDECRRLKQCYSSQAQDKVRLSAVFAKVISHMIKTSVQELGYIAIFIALVAAGIWMWRPSWAREQQPHPVYHPSIIDRNSQNKAIEQNKQFNTRQMIKNK